MGARERQRLAATGRRPLKLAVKRESYDRLAKFAEEYDLTLSETLEELVAARGRHIQTALSTDPPVTPEVRRDGLSVEHLLGLLDSALLLEEHWRARNLGIAEDDDSATIAALRLEAYWRSRCLGASYAPAPTTPPPPREACPCGRKPVNHGGMCRGEVRPTRAQREARLRRAPVSEPRN
jgi:hypothetical protein